MYKILIRKYENYWWRRSRRINLLLCFFIIRYFLNEYKKEKIFLFSLFPFGGDTRIRTGDQSFADSCLTTWLCRQMYLERKTGLEPATSTLARLHSTNWAIPAKQSKTIIAKKITKVKYLTQHFLWFWILWNSIKVFIVINEII